MSVIRVAFYEKMSLYNNLKVYAMIFGVDMKKVDELFKKWGSMIVATRWLKNVSTGKEATDAIGPCLD